MMLMRAKDMLQRITGFSTPLFGLSWNPPASDRDAVRRFLAFLEDRRALFNPLPAEVEDHVIGSIHTIREECVKAIGAMSDNAEAAAHTRAIGAACRRFLDEPYPTFEDIAVRRREPHFEEEKSYSRLRYRTDPAGFFTALGEFRAFVGTQIAMLSSLYNIDIHGDLVRILPPMLR